MKEQPGAQALPGVQAPKIRGLLLDRNVENRRAVRQLMRAKGIEIVAFADGKSVLDAWEAQGPFDFVLINPDIHDMKGLTVCKHIRSLAAIPILMYSSNHASAFIRQAYEAGADDYLQTPFAASQLIARLNKLLSVSGRVTHEQPGGPKVAYGDLIMDPNLRWVYKGDQAIELSLIQYNVLDYLVKNIGRVVSAEELIANVWGHSSNRDEHHPVHETIHSLQEKIEDDPTRPNILSFVENAGYRLG